MIVSDFEIYLRKAKEDIVVIRKLVADLEISDSSWGFHAHQAIEKLIKSILAKFKIEFSKTHDLVFLYELLPTEVLSFFSSLEDDCEALNPYAVSLRYDENIGEELDRMNILSRILDLEMNLLSYYKKTPSS